MVHLLRLAFWAVATVYLPLGADASAHIARGNCRDDSDCTTPGTFCRHSSICYYKYEDGNKCEDHSWCVSGYCDITQIRGQRTCKAKPAGLTTCTESSDCGQKQRCDEYDHVCVSSEIGSQCHSHDHCLSGYCDMDLGLCAAKPENVTTCKVDDDDDDDCETGMCDRDTLTCRKLYLNEPCSLHDECLTGRCWDGKCKAWSCPEDERVCPKHFHCQDSKPQVDFDRPDFDWDELYGATCVFAKTEGAPCANTSPGECGDGLCVDGTCTAPIKQRNPLGGSCDISKGHACMKGAYCENNKCLSDGRLAAKCDLCSNKVAFCDKEVCTARWSLHQACSKDYQCLSNRCQHGLCGTNEAKALGDPCKVDTDCNDGLECQVSQGIPAPGRICGEPKSEGHGQRCKKTSDCSSYNYYCYKGDCMSIDSVEGQSCDSKEDCGGQIRKEGSGGTWYLKIGFTCDDHKCHYANKHDGCVRFLDWILSVVDCYE